MDEKGFDYINMIPFIDVMLVLLTIVLTTSTFAVTGIIPVDLPRVTGRHETATVAHVVTIDKEGAVFFQGRPVNMRELKTSIGSVPRQTPILIKADKDIHLHGFIEVLDLVKTEGFKKVSVQTEWVGK